MTEREWLDATTNVHQMLQFVRTKTTARKKRLFACACYRLSWDDRSAGASRRAVEVSERFADGQAAAKELTAAARDARRVMSDRLNEAVGANWAWEPTVHYNLAAAAWMAAGKQVNALMVGSLAVQTLNMIQADDSVPATLLREVVGNPFRPVNVDPRHRTGTVLALAERASEPDFGVLPILADALEEAGFAEPSLLDHLRGPGPHHRGCWALDVVLGRS